jgi:nucleotide-binding universal stress UspA family protein
MELQQHAVVAGIDPSASARVAAFAAAEEAQARGVPLHLVHVVPWPNPGAAATRYADRTWRDELRRTAEELLADTASSLSSIVPPERIQSTVEFGDSAGELVAAAASAPLLFVGARGVGGVAGLIIGSTATAAAAHARCPVVVFPAGEVAAVPDRHSVVVGVEGTGRDEEVLSFAFAEAAIRHTELVAVHAWQDSILDPGFRSVSPLVDWSGVAVDEQRLLSEALAGHRDKEPDVVVREVVIRDRTAPALIATSNTAQLLVVGRPHGHLPARLGSATHAVLHRAGCPVAVVPGAPSTSESRS